MGLTAEDKVFVLRRFVNSYAQDLLTLHAALADPKTPEEAQRLLVGALSYALDKMDMFPDGIGIGVGVADDAIVLRIAAKLARAAGAKYEALEALAMDANNVINLFEDLASPLEKFVLQLPRREVRASNADKILTHHLSRAGSTPPSPTKPRSSSRSGSPPRQTVELVDRGRRGRCGTRSPKPSSTGGP